jgi:Cu/Ag efflux protein CusF
MAPTNDACTALITHSTDKVSEQGLYRFGRVISAIGDRDRLLHMKQSAVVVILALVVNIAGGCGQPPATTDSAAAKPAESAATPAAAVKKGEHVFHGKVEQVDAAAKTFAVNNENVEGWMSPMTMTYKASNPEIFDTVKVGDQITAKVYDGDFTTLHEVAIVSPK